MIFVTSSTFLIVSERRTASLNTLVEYTCFEGVNSLPQLDYDLDPVGQVCLNALTYQSNDAVSVDYPRIIVMLKHVC